MRTSTAALVLALALAAGARAQETRTITLRYAAAADLTAVLAPHASAVAWTANGAALSLAGTPDDVMRAAALVRALDLPSPRYEATVLLSAAAETGPAGIYKASVAGTEATTASFDLAAGRSQAAEGVKIVDLKGRLTLGGIGTGLARGELKLAMKLETPDGASRTTVGLPLVLKEGQGAEVVTLQVSTERTVRVELTVRPAAR